MFRDEVRFAVGHSELDFGCSFVGGVLLYFTPFCYYLDFGKIYRYAEKKCIETDSIGSLCGFKSDCWSSIINYGP